MEVDIAELPASEVLQIGIIPNFLLIYYLEHFFCN